MRAALALAAYVVLCTHFGATTRVSAQPATTDEAETTPSEVARQVATPPPLPETPPPPPPVAPASPSSAASTPPSSTSTSTSASRAHLLAGVDLVSRFIWRGIQFGDQWTLQPSVTVTARGFNFTVNATAAPSQHTLVDYVGLIAGYGYASRAGTFGFEITDWVFSPHRNDDGSVASTKPYFFDFRSGGRGGHSPDVAIYYVGPERFPIKLMASIIAYNDPDHSKYAAVSYPFALPGEFVLTTELGVAFGKSANWYFTDGDPVNVTNVGVRLDRTVELGRRVSMPIGLAFTVNPEAEQVYLVGSLGLRVR